MTGRAAVARAPWRTRVLALLERVQLTFRQRCLLLALVREADVRGLYFGSNAALMEAAGAAGEGLRAVRAAAVDLDHCRRSLWRCETVAGAEDLRRRIEARTRRGSRPLDQTWGCRVLAGLLRRELVTKWWRRSRCGGWVRILHVRERGLRELVKGRGSE